MRKFELIAPCHFGLEAVLKREITDLGYDVIKTEDGRVTFLGDEEAVSRINIFSRTAERILIKIGSFHAETFEELFLVPILYSMGNFLSHMTRDGNKDTMILRLDLKKTLAKEKVKVKVPSSSKNTSKKKTATKTITRTKVSLTSQTYYPCRILDTLEETPYVLYPMLADSPDAVLEPSQREELFAAYLRIANLYRDSNLKLHPSAAAPFLPEPSPPNLEDSNTGSDIGSDSGSGAA